MSQNWIDKIVQATTETESPERYYYWSAIATIAAVVSPNIYLNRYIYKLNPNLYVFLIGESGIKKGPPISLASNLVKSVDCTRVLKGRSTIQGIIKMMGRVITLGDNTTINDSRIFVAMSEYGAGLIQDEQSVTILTDLYDTYYNDEWDNTLSTVPVTKLIRPCPTILAGSNETNLEGALPPSAVEGGLVARMIIVHETKRRNVNSLAYAPKTEIPFEELSKYLLDLKKLKGEFRWPDDSRKFYDDWYIPFITNSKPDKTGTINRIGDTILKVGMCISLARQQELVLEKIHLEEAIEECLRNIPSMKRVTLGYGKGQLAYATKLVLNALMKRFPESIRRSNLLSNNWGEFDSIDLDKIIENLDQSQAIDIKIEMFGKKKDYIYTIKDEVYAKYKEFEKREEGQ